MSKTKQYLEDAAKECHDRIRHALSVYPFLSKSMLHMAIGTSTPQTLWNPVLDDMLESGDVVCSEHIMSSSTGRRQKYSIYHLSINAYSIPELNT